MGMLYNAHVAGSPVIVTAGQQDRRLLLDDPVLAGDMVSVARPWTKWSHEIHHAAELPAAIRRAVQVALTPPLGPVFLSLPIDVQLELIDVGEVTAPPIPDRPRPPQGALARAADLLASAHRPAILAGSRVTEALAVSELVRLAEKIGAPVYAECGTSHGRLPFPSDHPQYAGGLPLWSPDVHRVLDPFDVLLVVGMNLLREYIVHEPTRAIPAKTKLIHLDDHVMQIGRTYPVDVGLPGDIRDGLETLQTLIGDRPSGGIVARRLAEHAARREQRRADFRRRIEADAGQRPMTPRVMMASIADAIPPETAIIDEAATTSAGNLETLGAIRRPDGYFGHRGWALGWGIGCAIGVKIAWPNRPVLALIGDGAALYGIQGLWTAARRSLPVTFVICNNARYQILEDCAVKLPMAQLSSRLSIGTDLANPIIDFVQLAMALGVEAVRVTEPDEMRDRIRASLAGNRPQLIEVTIDRPSLAG
jgi:benzoylformate decarboxylase